MKIAIAFATALLAQAAIARDGPQPEKANPATAGATQSAAALSDGEVRKVDKDAKKITIKHGPLENLGMPAMTMVFQVEDPTMLDAVSAGDKVKFHAEKIGGALKLTKIERAQ